MRSTRSKGGGAAAAGSVMRKVRHLDFHWNFCRTINSLSNMGIRRTFIRECNLLLPLVKNVSTFIPSCLANYGPIWKKAFSSRSGSRPIRASIYRTISGRICHRSPYVTHWDFCDILPRSENLRR